MAILDINWMLGLGIMFGLALIMTVLTFKNIQTFFIWLTIFCAFTVWAGLVDLWILILCLIILGVMIAVQIRKRGTMV